MVEVLRLVLGDQLDRDNALVRDCGSEDLIWMAEVPEESEHVSSHKARSAYFFSAMRHFRLALEASGLPVDYHRIGEHSWQTIGEALREALRKHQPQLLSFVEPGDHRILHQITVEAEHTGIAVDMLPDSHFFTVTEDFRQWAQGRKSLRMEYFYREQRKRFGILMDGDKPCGGSWNFDRENRKSFDRRGPSLLTPPRAFAPDRTTREAIKDVSKHFPKNPGSTQNFDWPVTPKQAELALEDFIEHRLVAFGDYQDALWRDEPWLYHSRLSAAMNLKLLNPRRVVEEVERAYRNGRVSINAAEGFIRQILGWREYVRGLYFLYGEHYQNCNGLEADAALPEFYWHGNTEMRCLQQVIHQTLELGYAHHIQRLMVTGLFALLLGVRPREIHGWYLAVYVDAVEWVEMPNTLGMSQYADGGLMASKPYIASGKYIDRMSNYCQDCRYRPDQRTTDDACPFTVLYWDFLRRHQARFANHPRLALQTRNLARIDATEMRAIEVRAQQMRNEVDSL